MCSKVQQVFFVTRHQWSSRILEHDVGIRGHFDSLNAVQLRCSCTRGMQGSHLTKKELSA